VPSLSFAFVRAVPVVMEMLRAWNACCVSGHRFPFPSRVSEGAQVVSGQGDGTLTLVLACLVD
jgi:hypothetical protein